MEVGEGSLQSQSITVETVHKVQIKYHTWLKTLMKKIAANLVEGYLEISKGFS